MDLSQIQLSTPLQEPSPAQTVRDVRSPQAASAGQKDQQLQAAAKQFESIFVHEMLKQMQDNIKESSFDPEDSSNEQVHGMYCTFLADAVSQQGGVGLWEKIYEQMKQMPAFEGGSETLNTNA